MKNVLIAIRTPAIGIAVSLLLCTLLIVALGESPGVMVEAIHNSLFTGFGLGYTLFYATPLIFTGLGVAVAYHCGLFNIGAEGQLYVGAIAIVVVGTWLTGLPSIVAIPLGILAAALAGGFWGGIAGYLKAKRGSHEVIVTIMLNFIGVALVNYLILYPYDHPVEQAPETIKVAAGFTIPTFYGMFGVFKSTPVNAALLIAVLVAVATYLFLFYTSLGFELRAVGRNAVASRFAGVPVANRVAAAMALGGALSGLVGVNEVMGYKHGVIEGFSPGYGFTGIAVALLARSHPLGIILTALLFGALHNSARELEFITDTVSKELSIVLQGLLVAVVASDRWITSLIERKKKGAKANG